VAVSYKIFLSRNNAAVAQSGAERAAPVCVPVAVKASATLREGVLRKELASQRQLAALPKEFVCKAVITLVGIFTVLVKIGRQIVKERDQPRGLVVRVSDC
jgi:hypothetical protein